MKVLYGLPSENLFSHTAVTIGAFDGVHVAHQRILNKLLEYSKAHSVHAVVLTFWPHPAKITRPDAAVHILTDNEEKQAILAQMGVDYLVVFPFTQAFSAMSAQDFVKNILVDGLQAQKIIVGYDHRFGNHREGDIGFLHSLSGEFAFEVEEIERQWIDDAKISSTQIRQLLYDGHITQANRLLGRPYALSGRVVQGNKTGRILGFPTANVQIPSADKLIPAHGVYMAYVKVDNQTCQGVVNIGVRPTINGTALTIEAHILNFTNDIYGKNITLHLVEKIRDEVKFDSLEALKVQIHSDVDAAKSYFSINTFAL